LHASLYNAALQIIYEQTVVCFASLKLEVLFKSNVTT
jgi:hypothetical protein